MLYEIDESCLTVLSTNNNDVIAFFEQLALDRRKCKNLIIAKRDVFEKLAQTEAFSLLVREIYRKLGNRVSENKLILKNTKKYCRIIASDQKPQIVTVGEHEIILLPIHAGVSKDFTGKSIMLAENEDDISFYKIIGQFFMRQKEIGNIHINFEECNGGGSTISKVMQRIITEKNRMCLCIVDSDKKYGNASNGETMEKVRLVIKNVPQDFFDVLLLEIHEIENLIPLCILKEIIDKYNFDNQGLEFMETLIGNSDAETSPIFFFDLKKGIPMSAYFIDPNATEEKLKKYRKLEEYRKYWKKYIEAFGVKVEEKEGNNIINGVCEKVLKRTLEYLDKSKLDKITVDPYLREKWMSIGEKVYCWGCVGGRIAV